MTAAQAAAIAADVTSGVLAEQFTECITKITSAANAGDLEVYVYRNLKAPILSNLQGLGYVLTKFEESNDTFYKISWAHLMK